MKEHQKPGIRKKKVIDNGKINKELTEAKAHKNNKNPQNFLEIRTKKKKVFLSHKLKTMYMTNRTLLD